MFLGVVDADAWGGGDVFLFYLDSVVFDPDGFA